MTCNSNCDHYIKVAAGLRIVPRGLSLNAGEEPQVERAGDLDGFQGEGGRAERESDRINHLRVHQQLGTLTTVSQASLKGGSREQMRNSSYAVTKVKT